MNGAGRRAVIVHRSHGRTRLRIASERGNRGFFEYLASRLATVPGIARVEARAGTGSVLLHHADDWAAVADGIVAAGLFTIDDSAAVEQRGSESLVRNPPAELIAAGGLAALGVLQALRGEALPPAITLLWYAHRLSSKFLSPLSKE